MAHAEFSAALEVIFSQQKVASILSKLPPKSKIHGYDIGDYSGDDGMDVVLSVLREDAPAREIDVHFFLNDGPEFRLLRSLKRRYIVEPIEVGFFIDRGECYVTEKLGELAWRITGYSATEGTFRRVSEWTTKRMRTASRETAVGYERQYSYETLLAEEHYYGGNKGTTFLRQKYYDLPVFPSHLTLHHGMRSEIGDSSGLMITQGGSSWHGPDDSSVFCSARYDSSTVAFRVRMHDDRLLYHANADSSDHLSLHFDFSGKNRVQPNGKLQSSYDETQLGIRVIMGDGDARTPTVELLGSTLVERYTDAIQVTHLEMEAQYQTWEFTFRLPFELFTGTNEWKSVGFVCVYHDVDHPMQRRWVSLVSTAREYKPGRPETYGRLHFVEDPVHALEWENLRVIKLSRRLRAAGILR
ncbi:MAG: hypothetical protein KFH87_10260 [Bacteroidetes bacterium]|nr:hypothetical protein [Bacteroidota bacterium]